MIWVPPVVIHDGFNAASYFIDRHIEEGRGKNIAIECGGLNVTYRQLFDLVNRVGNGLASLGVQIEGRLFLLLLDTPEFAATHARSSQDSVTTGLAKPKPADLEFLSKIGPSRQGLP
jgi:non-ribosomal peptide synthetase component E (peptide arylation enzyme)